MNLTYELYLIVGFQVISVPLRAQKRQVSFLRYSTSHPRRKFLLMRRVEKMDQKHFANHLSHRDVPFAIPGAPIPTRGTILIRHLIPIHRNGGRVQLWPKEISMNT